MTRYVLKRLLLFIPALIAVSLIAFLILVNAPGDPVERLIGSDPETTTLASGKGGSDQRQLWIKKLGLDLPMFYVSVHQLSNLHSIDGHPSSSVCQKSDSQPHALITVCFIWQADDPAHLVLPNRILGSAAA